MIAYTENGIVAVLIPANGFTDTDIIKDVPEGSEYITVDTLPSDRLFRNAWVISEGSIIEDLTKAKEISHTIRREKRTLEFTPLDILVTIPSQAVAAEEARELIRIKYTNLQTSIDSCVDLNSLREITLTM